MFAQDFIRHAFLAGTWIAVSAGLVGYFVVLRNQVFVADAQGHVAFTGSLGALAFGVDPAVGLFAATVLGSMAMGGLGRPNRARDVAIGTTFAWVLGLGVLFLSLYTTARSTSNGSVGVTILFGSIYGLSYERALVAAAVGVTTTVVLLAMARPLLFASVDADIAAARGLPVRSLGLAFMALLGVTVGEAVQAVGALLVFGLLVTPAAAAQILTARPYAAMAVSVGLSTASLWAGLILSYVFQTIPPSFLVVTFAFVSYLSIAALKAVANRGGRDSLDSAGVAPHPRPG